MIAALTGVRAVAAGWVVVYHFQGVLTALIPALGVVEPLVAAGYMGVDVFFVLSGFIIAHNYATQLAVLDGRRYRDYLVARFARVYPVHLFALLMTLGLVALAAANGREWSPGRGYTPLGFGANLLMLQGIPGVPLWNVPSWSITCEVAAYIVFPLAAGLLLRLGTRTAAALAVAVVVLEVAVLVPTFAVSTVGLHWWTRIAAEFTVGCLLWRVWRSTSRSLRHADAAAAGSFAGGPVVLAAGAHPYFLLPFVAVFVPAAASATGVVARILASRPLQWGGRISYSLYLVHVPVFQVLLVLHSPRWFTGSSLPVRLGLVAGYAVALLAAAALTRRLVEEPARRWLRRRPAPDEQPRAGVSSGPG